VTFALVVAEDGGIVVVDADDVAEGDEATDVDVVVEPTGTLVGDT
jgi:hypothetical protein